MTQETTSQKCILKDIHETINYFVKEINQIDLMTKKRVYKTLYHIQQALIIVSAISRCVSILLFFL